MTEREFTQRLGRRTRRANLLIPDDVVSGLRTYVDLLSRWNTKINLTALPLSPPTDETFDRLLVEPLAAAKYVGDSVRRWADLGSGGGSPAVPLRIACPAPELVMVESKARKAAFLREAIRAVPLEKSSVENVRFEELARRDAIAQTFDLVTTRAVRVDASLAVAVRALLSDRGRLMLFRPDALAQSIRGLRAIECIRLGTEAPAFIALYERNVPRGTSTENELHRPTQD